MSKKNEMPVDTIEATKKIPIKWNMPENIVTRFATNMLVQTIEEGEFKISFFELKPIIHFSEDEQLPKEVPADCIASIIVTASRLPGFIEVLQKQMNIYKAKKAID